MRLDLGCIYPTFLVLVLFIPLLLVFFSVPLLLVVFFFPLLVFVSLFPPVLVIIILIILLLLFFFIALRRFCIGLFLDLQVLVVIFERILLPFFSFKFHYPPRIISICPFLLIGPNITVPLLLKGRFCFHFYRTFFLICCIGSCIDIW